MQDIEIIDLLKNRDEKFFVEVNKKYGAYLSTVALNILGRNFYIDECLNDTYLRVWNAQTAPSPEYFKMILCKITRGIAVDIMRHESAQKRAANNNVLTEINELRECVYNDTVESAYDAKTLGVAINNFLAKLTVDERKAFIRRYFFCDSLGDIAANFGCSTSKIKSLLFRLRKKLKNYLESEGYVL